MNELYKQNKFQEWGVSNYAAWEVVEIYYLCKANNWKPPTVYQGMYNYATRDVEKELFPALRRYDIVIFLVTLSKMWNAILRV